MICKISQQIKTFLGCHNLGTVHYLLPGGWEIFLFVLTKNDVPSFDLAKKKKKKISHEFCMSS